MLREILKFILNNLSFQKFEEALLPIENWSSPLG